MDECVISSIKKHSFNISILANSLLQTVNNFNIIIVTHISCLSFARIDNSKELGISNTRVVSICNVIYEPICVHHMCTTCV